MTAFDPDAAGDAAAGVFGLPLTREVAQCWLLPVPFAATVSYGGGAENGPAAIRAASVQVDLQDIQTGRPYEAGIWMDDADPAVMAAGLEARAIAEPIIRRGGVDPDDPADREAMAVVDRAGELVNDRVGAWTASALAAGRVPGILGGDHSVPLGAIREAARSRPGMGILHFDAHMDLRRAYEGFQWSHASIMDNVLAMAPGVERIVQVGIRDFGAEEVAAAAAAGERVVVHYDLDWRRRMARGETLGELMDEVVAALPPEIWVSFDIDGLDPSLCPSTGTPVPGGLLFHEACLLLETAVASGRRILGFDLVEVAPGAEGEWDAAVGARILYKLCGFALQSRPESS